MGRRHTKTDIVVEVVDIVPVAVRTAGVPLIVVEGTAPKHTALIGPPRRPKATSALYR
jgi:hypothetical protein